MAVVSPYDQGKQDEYDRLLKMEGISLLCEDTVGRTHPVLREIPVVRAVDINSMPVNLIHYINNIR